MSTLHSQQNTIFFKYVLGQSGAVYSSQSGAVHGGRPFDIQRGVKQGDILSPMLFNAALECALRKWKLKCEHHGIAMAHHERLTNIRYADDLMLYARFCQL